MSAIRRGEPADAEAILALVDAAHDGLPRSGMQAYR